MRILIVTDAWQPQVNGVVRTLMRVVEELRQLGHAAKVISPDQFKSFPCPPIPRSAWRSLPRRRLAQLINAFEPCAIHIATEGPLGLAARRDLPPLGPALHHQLPHPLPGICLGPPACRWPPAMPTCSWFHKPSGGLMVATPTMREELAAHGFRNISALVPGRRHRAVPPARETIRTSSPTCRGRSSSTSAGWRWRRTSRPSWASTCPAPRWWSATARSCDELHASVSQGGFAGSKQARTWPPLRRRRRLRLPLAHRHLRPGDPGGAWPRARRWRPFRCRTPGCGQRLRRRLPRGGSGLGRPPRPHDLPQACRDFALQFSWRRSAEQFLGNLQPFDPAINKPAG